MGETRVLSNGAIYDMTVKRIVGNPGGGSTAITQANASALSKSRWQQRRERYESGLTKAMISAGQLPAGDTLPAAAWEVIGELSGQWLLDATTARDYAQLLHEVRATVQDRDEPAVAGAAIGAVAGVVGAILAAISARQAELDCDVAEAEARDAEDVE